MRTFSREPVMPTKCPHETPTIAFDFSAQLADGEVLRSVTSTTVTTAQGYDEAPQDLIYGTPERDGPVVFVQTTGGLDGVYYRIEVLAVTDGNRTVSQSAVLPVIEL